MDLRTSNSAAGATTINPATGEIFAFHPFQSADDVSTLLDNAVAAFEHWRAVPVGQRVDVLTRLAAVLRKRSEAFARDITQEMGKPITQARAEIAKCASTCEWYAQHGPEMIADEPTTVEGDAAHIAYLPLGVVLGIMPWNYPFWQALRAIIPIILAGNAFVLKHAPNSMTTACNVVEALEQAGAPTGLVSALNIAQPNIQAVIEDRRIAAVTLTGSVQAGSAVAAQAGGAIKRTVLELGGSDPFIVLADADLDKAVATAVTARFQNGGQTCIAAKRIIVEASVAEAFTARFVAAVKALEIGEPTNESTVIGPMARGDLRDQLFDQVKRSLDGGATLLLDGGPFGPEGTAFFRPVVLGNVAPGIAAFDEETFGPCAAIVVAEDAEDAIALANHSEFGLSSSIWTSDIQKAKEMARRIEAGGVFINGMSRSDPRVPMGGVRKSGYGRELSYFGAREFTNAKLIWVDG